MVDQLLDNTLQKSEKEGLEVFIAYAKEDKRFYERLERQLSPLLSDNLIKPWQFGEILPGREWSRDIQAHLDTAHIILLLISPNFLFSKKCTEEMERGVRRHKNGEAYLIPVILISCDWERPPLQSIEALPTKGKPVDMWSNRNSAFLDIAKGIRKVVEEENKKREREAKDKHKTPLPPSRLWEVPYRQNPMFKNYHDVVEKVSSTFTNNNETEVPRLVSIVGFLGSGKTQIALEYAYKYRESYGAVWWLKADARESLDAEYRAIANKLQLLERDESDQSHIIQSVNNWLEKNKNWLLIFDNIHPDMIDTVVGEFVPVMGKGHVLFTSTYQATSSMPKIIRLRALTPEEGANLLLSYAGMLVDQALPQQIKQAHEISLALDQQPLALAQAGTYIDKTGCNLSNYLTIYGKSSSHLRWSNESGSGGPQSVYNTVSLALERVKEQRTSMKFKQKKAKIAAMDLLYFCAFLAPSEIPEKIITQGAPTLSSIYKLKTSDPEWLDMAVAELIKFSLMQRNAEVKTRDPSMASSGTLTIHSLVQAVIKSKMDRKTKVQWAELTVQAVNRTFPDIAQANSEAATFYEQEDYNSAESRYQYLLSRYQQLLAENHPSIVTCLRRLTRIYYELGVYSGAERYAIQARDLCLRIWEESHPETASCYNDLIALSIVMGDYEQATMLCKEVWERCGSDLKQDSAIRASYLYNRAELDHIYSRFAEAEQGYMRVLAIREKLFGRHHRSVTTCLNALGKLYHTWGNYDQAEQRLMEALNLRQETLEPGHTDLAISFNSLAELYLSMGDFVPVEALYKDAIAICRKSTGEDHPIAAPCFHTLAKLYHVNARYKEADRYYQQAQEIYAKKLGSGHPSVATNLNDLGSLYCDRYGDLSYHRLAQQYCSEARDICKKALGPDHPGTAMCLSNLAEISLRMQEYSEAQDLYIQAIEICKGTLGREHPATLQCSTNLVKLFCIQGKYAEAEEYYRLELKNGERILGSDHPQFATQLSILAELYHAQGKYIQAVALHEKVLTIRKDIKHPDVATCLFHLATLYRILAKYTEAQAKSQRALLIREELLGSDHPATAISLNELGELNLALGRYTEVETLCTRALAISQKALGKDSLISASCHNTLGQLYHIQAKYGDAKEHYGQAFAIRTKVLGSKHPDVAITLNNLGRLYDEQGLYDQTEPYYQQSLAIREAALGREHSEFAISLGNSAGLSLSKPHAKTETFYKQVEASYKEALKIYRATFHDNHPDIAQCYAGLARLFFERAKLDGGKIDHGKLNQSVQYYLKALKISEQVLGSNHFQIAIRLNNLASIYYIQGNEGDEHKYKMAAMFYLRARKICQQTVGPLHPFITQINSNYSSLPESVRYEANGNL